MTRSVQLFLAVQGGWAAGFLLAGRGAPWWGLLLPTFAAVAIVALSYCVVGLIWALDRFDGRPGRGEHDKWT